MIDLFAPGAYCRAVGGNLERPDIQAPVVRWLAYSINPDNGADGDVRAWDTCRGLWHGADLEAFPWLHVRTLNVNSILSLDRLISVGLAEGSPAIGLNIEDVVGDKLDLEAVADRLERWPRPVHMPTLGWVQNGQGWGALARVVAALEIFPDEAPAIAADVSGCISHAFAEGLVNVTLMFKTKAPNAPEDYDLGTCHSFYTADDITPTAEAWALWDAPEPCEKLGPVAPSPWYERPYATGPPVGPDKLPRALYPPKAGKGTQTGDDVLAYKRAISRGGRLLPWSPPTWSPAYGDAFALGDGSGSVGKSGVRGFQRQTWPDDAAQHTGNLGDRTYQALRRARVSDPESLHFGEPLLDRRAVTLLRSASGEFQQDAKVAAWRVAVADFCNRAEAASPAAWTYSMDRPFQGFGVEPEKAHRTDCSGYFILAYFWGRSRSGLLAPDPSDFGYTGLGSTREIDDNPRVTSGNYLVGDGALYDGAGHVTICKRPGDASTSRWSSFGGEPRPEERTLHYRPDFLYVVRPPLE